jgi:DNA-binding transcriptional ArsR family regulator
LPASTGETLWVVRTFDPQLLRRDPLRRAEVLGPLNALADDTRLRILELLVEHGEQRAQEIIAQLEGSQGNVSRHLKQLVGAGLARERRAGDANKLYTYDAGRSTAGDVPCTPAALQPQCAGGGAGERRRRAAQPGARWRAAYPARPAGRARAHHALVKQAERSRRRCCAF